MQRFMNIAMKEAYDNVPEGGPFGAVIVRGDEIISIGQNHVTCNNDPTAHAEIVAIRKACEKLDDFSLKGCSLYTSCEPCPMCLSAIYWSHIDKIYYHHTRQDAHDARHQRAFFRHRLATHVSDLV